MSALRRVLLATLLSGAPFAAVASAPPALEARGLYDEDASALAGTVLAVQELLDEQDLAATVTARVKAPASLHAKAARKGVAPDQVLDRLGLRVHVDAVDDCYAVREIVHDRFEVVPGSVDDYIAEPKANGYQSLHSAVDTGDTVVEVQIRTHAMHAHAEHGPAAHWRYKAAQG